MNHWDEYLYDDEKLAHKPKHVGHKFGCLTCQDLPMREIALKQELDRALQRYNAAVEVADTALAANHELKEELTACEDTIDDIYLELCDVRKERDMWKRMFCELISKS